MMPTPTARMAAPIARDSSSAMRPGDDDERRLARQRQAEAFQADDAGDHEQAVFMNEMGNGWHGIRLMRRPHTYTYSPINRNP